MASGISSSRMVTLIQVKKMSRAIKFYTKVLGGKLLEGGRGEMKDFWASLQVGGTGVWLVGADKPEKKKLAYQAFLVKDIRSTVKELQKKKVKFERAERASKESRVEGPIGWEPWGGSAFFKDSEGNLLMVWQNIPPM